MSVMTSTEARRPHGGENSAPCATRGAIEAEAKASAIAPRPAAIRAAKGAFRVDEFRVRSSNMIRPRGSRRSPLPRRPSACGLGRKKPIALRTRSKRSCGRRRNTSCGGTGCFRGREKRESRFSVLKSTLPAADPGDFLAHRWRHKFCAGGAIDEAKLGRAIEDAQRRSLRICEQQNANTIRGTEGTGEFERYTPAEYIKAVRAVLGEIDLDPATSVEAQAIVKATQFFTVEDDGLGREWHGRVFLNPPYHRELAPQFVDKLIAEVAAKRTTAAIMLTNNSTDTEWFQRAIAGCAALCFTKGRINFWVPNGGDDVSPTQGQAFFHFGDDRAKFREVFGAIGSVLIAI